MIPPPSLIIKYWNSLPWGGSSSSLMSEMQIGWYWYCWMVLWFSFKGFRKHWENSWIKKDIHWFTIINLVFTLLIHIESNHLYEREINKYMYRYLAWICSIAGKHVLWSYSLRYAWDEQFLKKNISWLMIITYILTFLVKGTFM